MAKKTSTKYNSFVQITHKSVRLISCDTLQLITEYVPSSGSNKITVGALTSVFKVMFEVQPGTAEQMGVSAEELAAVTAEQAFVDADLNHDGKLSFDEFQTWYAADAGQAVETVTESTPSWVSLKEVRRLTALENHDVEEVFEEFAVAADDEGLIDAEAFTDCFRSPVIKKPKLPLLYTITMGMDLSHWKK